MAGSAERKRRRDCVTLPRALVTGTSGFIASHLAELLASRGYQVMGLDNRPASHRPQGIELVTCDLLDARRLLDTVRHFRPEVVYHLAARTDLDERVSVVDGYAANVDGVSNIIAAAHAGGAERFVLTSTQLVSPIGYQPTHDEDFTATTQYGKSKVRSEQLLREADGSGSTWCIARPTTVWGPRMNPAYLRFFRLLIGGRYFHVGRRPIMKTYGYVGNLVRQLLALGEAPAERVNRKVFYVADYEPMAVQDWAEALRKALGAPPIRTLPRFVARAMAIAGDSLVAMGVSSFPYHSGRLRNVITPFQSDTSRICELCPDLPYALPEAAKITADWVRAVLETEVAAA